MHQREEDVHSFGLNDHVCGPGCECGRNIENEDGSQDEFVIRGTKWGTNDTTGTSGGVVTWSLAGTVYDDYIGAASIALSTFLNFDYVAALKAAFQAWENVTGLKFVHVQDDGTTMNDTTTNDNSDIRINGGYIDGSSGTLAYAFYPTSQNAANEYDYAGNMTFDSGETTFWNYNSFLIVAMHEIGHAIGIEHSLVNSALMAPYYNPALTGLTSDDIAAGQAIYGTAANQTDNFYMKSGNTTLTLIEDKSGVTVHGTTGSDSIATTGGIQIINGGNGNDFLSGGADSDTLSGGSDNDLLDGGSGADVLNGGLGIDSAYYYNASSSVTVNLTSGGGTLGDAAGDTYISVEDVHGSNNDGDVIIGDGNNNRLWGFGGNDFLSGAGGEDILSGGNGNDLLDGGVGADILNGGTGIDSAYYYNASSSVTVNLTTGVGTLGDAAGDTYISVEDVHGSNNDGDVIIGDGNNNRLWGFGGNDFLSGAAGNDYFSGGNGNDLLEGGLGADTLNGGSGIDSAYYYNAATDVFVNLTSGIGSLGDANGDAYVSIEDVHGSNNGSDAIVGDANNNRIWGFGGNDYLSGVAGVDALSGGDGNDLLDGGLGADTLNGGSGIDSAYYYNASTGINVNLTSGVGTSGDANGDTYVSIEDVHGSNFGGDLVIGDANNNRIWGFGGNDFLSGAAGEDTLSGGNGNDLLEGGIGRDTLDGGSGIDSAYYYNASTGVNLSLASGKGTFGDADGDTYISIEDVHGSNDGGDSIIGDANSNRFWGFGGNDTLNGGNGDDFLSGGADDDTLTGGAGNDVLSGGLGNDVFVFSNQIGNDVITDFQAGAASEDVIEIQGFAATYSLLADIIAVATEDGVDTTITLDGDTKIVLNGLLISDLHESDFTFV